MTRRRTALFVAATTVAAFVAGTAAPACSNDNTLPSSQFVGTSPNDGGRVYPDGEGPADEGTPPNPHLDGNFLPPTDAPPPFISDGAPPRPLDCPTTPCASGQECCAVPNDAGTLDLACLASCPGGQFPVSCDGRDQCQQIGESYCCGLLQVGAGTPPRCPYTSGFSTCMDSCTTSFNTSCPAMVSDKPCQAASDCANDPAGETNCCTFGSGPLLTFCASDNLKAMALSCL